MEIIEQYLDDICCHIKNVPYRRALRRELQGHLEDHMEAAAKSMGNKSTDNDGVAKNAIAAFGDAAKLGEELNRRFPVRPSIRLLLYVAALFCLHTAAGIPNGFSFSELLNTLLGCAFCTALFLLLKKTDLERKHYLIQYLYAGNLILLFMIAIHMNTPSGREWTSICGTILLFCIIFWIYRLHQSGTTGLIIALCLFLLPVPLLFAASAYAVLLLYVVVGFYAIVSFIGLSWIFTKRRIIIFSLTLAVLCISIAFFCRGSLLMKWTLWDLSLSPAGSFHALPLSEYIHRFGYWAAIIYLVFFFFILTELIRMRQKVHSSWGRNLLGGIALMIAIKGFFAVSTNLGFPVIRSYTLPFAGFSPDQLANMLLIVMAQYAYCFGNAVFGDYSFLKENELFKIENGRVTFYYRHNHD